MHYEGLFWAYPIDAVARIQVTPGDLDSPDLRAGSDELCLESDRHGVREVRHSGEGNDAAVVEETSRGDGDHACSEVGQSV